MITFEQFARLFGFGQNVANHHKIHYALHFDASKMRFMFPRNKRESVGMTVDLFPFYAYLTLFERRSRKSWRALSRVMVMYPTLCI
jgi:RNA polymerase-interacting CarD/CdnL/TRCF family regulator